MTIKRVEIDTNDRLSAEEAMGVLSLLLDEQVLKNIESFQAVAVLGQRSVSENVRPISLASKLQVTTRDLPDEDVNAAIKEILVATEKLALEDTQVVNLFSLEFQKPPRVTSK